MSFLCRGTNTNHGDQLTLTATVLFRLRLLIDFGWNWRLNTKTLARNCRVAILRVVTFGNSVSMPRILTYF